jgi:L,D-transpeptidase ErfK/SrfK
MKTMLKTKAYIALLLSALAAPCRATVYDFHDPEQNTFGEDQYIQTVYEDTLYDLARRYSLGSEELIRVNPGIDPWLPGAGETVLIPGRRILPSGPREGVVISRSR